MFLKFIRKTIMYFILYLFMYEFFFFVKYVEYTQIKYDTEIKKLHKLAFPFNYSKQVSQ